MLPETSEARRVKAQKFIGERKYLVEGLNWNHETRKLKEMYFVGVLFFEDQTGANHIEYIARNQIFDFNDFEPPAGMLFDSLVFREELNQAPELNLFSSPLNVFETKVDDGLDNWI